MSTDKPIRLSHHAQLQLPYRGALEVEVAEAIRSSAWEPAELGRLECRKDFVYNSNWNDKHYRTKQVRSIFADEKNEIVVVTVYVYYF